MKIKSLSLQGEVLIPVEVEVNLIPGLPTLQFLGLPDQTIRESAYRIRSAIKARGFEWPKGQQILVNLYPSNLKKSSPGLELAVALGILKATAQIKTEGFESFHIFGELSLGGEVYQPEQLKKSLPKGFAEKILTGRGREEECLPVDRYILSELNGVDALQEIKASLEEFQIKRPSDLELEIPISHGELLKILALGEHNALLAGPAGSGKTTLAKILHGFLEVPSQKMMGEILENNLNGKATIKPTWRPLIQPHHSTSLIGLIGGGVPVFKGDIVRAHQGLMILDELLEFNPKAQEALREPLEEGVMRVRRGRYFESHLADALVIATTNLCPCGDWVPNSTKICGRSLIKCRSYAERLSGPLVDRFSVVFFTTKKHFKETVHTQALFQEIERVRSWRVEHTQQDLRFRKVSNKWNYSELVRDLSEFYINELMPKELGSRRRLLSTLRVARTLADLRMSHKMEMKDVEQALFYTFRPFEDLKRL